MDAPTLPSPDRIRLDFVLEALSQEGKPYIYDAKGPDTFDCSGLVTWCLERATGGRIRWRPDHNAAALADACQALSPGEVPEAGDLAFYGPSDGPIDHVMIFMGSDRVFGASGGGRHCTDLVTAARLHTCVHYRSPVAYRPDFRGFRRLPMALPVDPVVNPLAKCCTPPPIPKE